MHDLILMLTDFLSQHMFSIGETTVSVGGFLSGAVCAILVWWLAGFLERSLLRLNKRYADEAWKVARIHMLGRLLRYGVWVVGTMILMAYAGIDLSSVTLLGSALAVGLGFGLKSIVNNFVSGLIILMERSLKVGDFVDLQSGVRGTVREVAMRYTRVTTNDSLDILVPNSEFINGRVANWTLDDAHRRMRIPFGVAYGTPKEKVREAGVAAAQSIEGVIEIGAMRSDVWLVSYGDSAVNYELVVWADRKLTGSPASSHAKLMWALDDQLIAHGIEIPFPQRDLHIRSGMLNVRMAPDAAPATDRSSGSAGTTGRPT